jgi:hypothetical protein
MWPVVPFGGGTSQIRGDGLGVFVPRNAWLIQNSVLMPNGFKRLSFICFAGRVNGRPFLTHYPRAGPRKQISEVSSAADWLALDALAKNWLRGGRSSLHFCSPRAVPNSSRYPTLLE